MKRTTLYSVAIVLSLLVATQQNLAQGTAALYDSKSFSSQETIHLFNGKNLDGWYTFIKGRGRNNDPQKVFKVDHGAIHISGEDWGCITTNNEFKNYRLVVEYKWGEKTFGSRANNARDNGILFHSKGEDGGYDGTWMHSIECNVIEGGTGDFIVVGNHSNDYMLISPAAPEKQNGSYIYQPGGDPVTINSGRINWFGRDPEWKDVKGFRGKNDIEKPIGQWNKLECVVRDSEIFIYLNGTLVNHAIYTKPSEGRIQIQAEGAEIFYRRIDLTPLPEIPPFVPEG